MRKHVFFRAAIATLPRTLKPPFFRPWQLDNLPQWRLTALRHRLATALPFSEVRVTKYTRLSSVCL